MRLKSRRLRKEKSHKKIKTVFAGCLKRVKLRNLPSFFCFTSIFIIFVLHKTTKR